MKSRPGYKPLGEPTEFPDELTLDSVFKFVEEQRRGWKFTPPLPPKPYITWSMVKQIEAAAEDDKGRALLIIDIEKLAEILKPGGVVVNGSGTLKVTEQRLMELALKYVGDYLVCGDANGFPIAHGEPVQRMIDELMAE